jgi:hypothetical protein
LQGPAGPQGLAGPVGLNFMGAYSSTVNYALGDGVLFDGAGFVSLIANNVGNTPSLSPQDWSMFAASGAAGATGAQGLQGVPGVNGLDGAPGAQGVQGAPGAQGVAGSPGLVYQGAYSPATDYGVGDVVVFDGASFVSLVVGNVGQTPGESPAFWGVLTSVGPQGVAGPAGAPGAVGPAGPQGLVGAAGPAGVAGPMGVQGPAGLQGLTGANGAVGPAGPQGLPGVAGTAGAQGIPGATGAAGAAGATGATGAQGPQGPAGATGATGAAGAVGMNFRGVWSAVTEYAVNDAVTFAGSTYLALAAGNNAEPDLNPGSWAVLAQAGGVGATGATGAAATVSVGSVTTLAAGAAATVTNSGTVGAAVLNFGIPQGAAGTGGSGTGSGSGTSSGSFAAISHGVSFNTTFYAVNSPTASTTETSSTAAGGSVLAWVPQGCTATELEVFSQQSNTITVTLRVGSPGALAASALACSAATNGSCTATGPVVIAAGDFIDFQMSGASGTTANVWTSLQCQ